VREGTEEEERKVKGEEGKGHPHPGLGK